MRYKSISNMHEPLISVVIPVYKGEAHIAQSIDSALEQDYQHIEIIIINDGSPDDSHKVIKGYLSDPRVHYIEQDNAGVANARNTGINSAKGEFIALLDQDDIWLPNKLAAQVEHLNRHPNCALIHSQIGFINGDGDLTPNPSWAWVNDTGANAFENLFDHNCIATFMALIRKDALNEVGMFRESLAPADDWDLWLRIASKYEVGFIPEVSGYYRVHANNESNNYLRMQLAEVAVIENIINEFTCSKNLPGSTVRNLKRFHLYHSTAALYARAQDYHSSRSFLRKAIKVRPLAIRCYLTYAWLTLPANLRVWLKWHYSRLSNGGGA